MAKTKEITVRYSSKTAKLAAKLNTEYARIFQFTHCQPDTKKVINIDKRVDLEMSLVNSVMYDLGY